MRMRRRFKMASSCKGVPVTPNYESSYSVMDEDFNPSLHILDQSERELCGNEVYLVLLHREKIGQIGIFDLLDGKGLERSEGTSSVTQ